MKDEKSTGAPPTSQHAPRWVTDGFLRSGIATSRTARSASWITCEPPDEALGGAPPSELAGPRFPVGISLKATSGEPGPAPEVVKRRSLPGPLWYTQLPAGSAGLAVFQFPSFPLERRPLRTT